MDLAKHLEMQKKWSKETFGPGDRTRGILDHLHKELAEVADSQGMDLEEWIDIAILAFDGAWRAGFSPEEIVNCLWMKQCKNEERDWPDWRKAEPGKAIEHIRDGD